MTQKTFDVTNALRSALNLMHYTTGQREINFTRKEVVQRLVQIITKSFGNLPIESEAEIFVTVNTNLGLQHFHVPVVAYSANNTLEFVMEQQKRRLMVENERSRVTKERFDVLLPQCGMFSHVYQMKGFYRSRDPFNLNCFVFRSQEYFAGCAITNSQHLMDLHEEYQTWDRTLLTRDIGVDDCLVLLTIRPWELLVVKIENIIFL